MSAHDENQQNSKNGHREPPFRLAPIQSPEEEARDKVLRSIAPQLRRAIREDDRLSVGAKFFWVCLFDDCFWREVGGFGTGQLFADIDTLALRYHHDERSIRNWRDELEETGWLWTNYEWPMTEWRLTSLMPAPTEHKHKKALQRTLGLAASGKSPESSKTGPEAQKGGDSAKNPKESGTFSRRARENDPDCAEQNAVARGTECSELAEQNTAESGKISRERPHSIPGATAKNDGSDGKTFHSQVHSVPQEHAVSSNGRGQKGSGETTPRSMEKGVKGGGGTPAPENGLEEEIKAWRASLNGCFQSKLEKKLSKFKAQLRTASAAKNEAASRLRDLLERKIAILSELIDGPGAGDVEAPKAAVDLAAIATRQPTQDEIEEGKRFLEERRRKAVAK
jgi:hypothetical protein